MKRSSKPRKERAASTNASIAAASGGNPIYRFLDTKKDGYALIAKINGYIAYLRKCKQGANE